MAEVFGVVSGAVGTAGVAVQFAESIRKIYLFCKDVRDAPDQLRRAADELQLLSHILDSMAIQLQRDSLAYDSHASLPVILHSCRQGQEEMSALLNDLQKNVSRRRGAVRAVLKSTEIKKHLTKIERAKSALQIAQNIFHGHLVQQGFGSVSTRIDQLERHGLGSVAARFDRLESLIIASLRPTSTDTHNNKTCTSGQPRNTLEADTEGGVMESNAILVTSSPWQRSKSKPSARIRMQPLPWLWRKTWDLAVYRTNQGWDFSIRTYRTISSVSPFFQACEVGNILAIQSMLSMRIAFPSDQDEKGRTALHYLANACNGGFAVDPVSRNTKNNNFDKAAGILISEGADIKAVNSQGILALDLLGLHYYEAYDDRLFSQIDHTGEGSVKVNLVRALSRSLVFDFEDKDSHQPATLFRNASPDCIKLLQGRMVPSWTEVPFLERVGHLFVQGHLLRSQNPDSFLAWTGIDNPKALWSSCTSKVRDRLLMASIVSMCHEEGRGKEEMVGKWRDIIFDSKSIVADFNPCLRCVDYSYIYVSGSNGYDHKSLECVKWCDFLIASLKSYSRGSGLGGYWQYNEIQRGLTFFISELYALGVNLANFGDVESAKWHALKQDGEYSFYYELWDDDHDYPVPYYMIGFDYGPKPEDWRAWVYTPFCGWAGEFWDLIDNPRKAKRKVPGAFPDEASDNDSDNASGECSDEYLSHY